MSLQYPKKFRGGVNMVGAEQVHIYRDPQKAIHTRKYEPVDVADVMYFSDPTNPLSDPTRINDAINMYERGRDPMKKINYGGEAIYKVEVVRPPLFPAQSLNAISRPDIHINYSVTTNPGIAPNINQQNSIDKAMIKNATTTDKKAGVIRANPSMQYRDWYDQLGNRDSIKLNKEILTGGIRPSASYDLDETRGLTEMILPKMKEDVLTFTVNSGVKFNDQTVNPFQDSTLRGTATREAFQYSSQSNVNNSSQTTNPFDMSKYDGKATHSETLQYTLPTQITMNQLFSGVVGPENYQVSYNAIKEMQKIGVGSNPNFGNIVIVDPKTNASLDVQANIKEKNYIGVTAALGLPIEINTGNGQHISIKDYNYSVVQTAVGNPQMVIQVAQPDIKLERNTPIFAANTVISSSTGYDDGAQRMTQGQFNSKRISNFGEFVDRTAKDTSGRSLVSTNGSIGKGREKIVAK